MNCNIDSKGKRMRLTGGIAAAAVGIVLALFWALPIGGPIAWGISFGFLAGGAFMIFEARAGWCALRAMGFKTRF
jgi:hypothetical protein